MANATSGNQVIVYFRNSEGTLALNGVNGTGGMGSGVGLVFADNQTATSSLQGEYQDNRFFYKEKRK